MAQNLTSKRHIVTSFQNLPPELQDALKQKYPLGYTDSMIRIEKGNGNFFYAVVLETAETNYLVKVDVKIDGKIEEEEEKGYGDKESDEADEVADGGGEESDGDD